VGSVRRVLANRAAPPRDRSANAADTAGSIALGSRSAAARPARSAPCAAARRTGRMTAAPRASACDAGDAAPLPRAHGCERGAARDRHWIAGRVGRANR